MHRLSLLKPNRMVFFGILLIAHFLFWTSAYAQDLEHFDPVANTGVNRPVVVDTAMIGVNGAAVGLNAGDEVAVFDDTLCVGAGKLGSFPLVFSSRIRFIAVGDTLPGAVIGHTMTFKIWDKETDEEFDATPYYRTGGTFGDPLTEVDSLKAIVSTVTIQVNPAGLGLKFYIDGVEYSEQQTFFMNIDSVYTLSVDSLPNVSGMPSGERYRFGTWSNNGSPIATQDYTVPPAPVTVTANFLMQYFLTTAESPDEGGDVTPPPPGAWYDTGFFAQATAVANTGWTFIEWTGDSTGTNNPVVVEMDRPKSVTANFKRVFQITVRTDPPNLNYTADAVGYSAMQTFTWIEGSEHQLSVPTPQAAGPGVQWAFSSWSNGGDTTHTYTVPSADDTVTASFTRQYLLTLDTDHGTTHGAGWYDEGTQAAFGLDSTTVDTTNGTRFVFTGWVGTGAGAYSGPVNDTTVTMNNPIIETAQWQTQYLLTVNSTYGGPTGEGWYNAGANATFSLSLTRVIVGLGIREVFIDWTGVGTGAYSGTDSSYTVVMNNAITETAAWQREFNLKIIENPDAGGDVTLDPPGNPPSAPFDNWYLPNTDVELDVAAAPSYQFLEWSGDLTGTADPDTITVNAPKTVMATFRREVQVTIMTNPDTLEYTADGVTYDTTQTFTWLEGTQHPVSVVSPQAGATGVQYVWRLWNDGGSQSHNYIVPTEDDTLIAEFRTQYRLTVNSNWGTTTGDGWYDAGWIALFSVTPGVVPGQEGVQYIFAGWNGTGAGSYTGAVIDTMVTMNNPITETAQWTTQYRLTVVCEHGTSTGDGWYDAGTDVPFSVTPTMIPGLEGIRYVFEGWQGTGNGAYTGVVSDTSVTMNNPIEEVADWTTQYYLSTSVNPVEWGNITPAPPGDWFDSGDRIPMQATAALGYKFAGWSDDHLGTVNPDTITMDEPKSVTANFGREVLVVVQTNPDGLEFTVDDSTYNLRQTFTWIENSQHTLSAPASQNGLPGVRHAFISWSNGGERTHTYSVPIGSDTVTANFQLQYLLTLDSPFGNISGQGWYNAGTIAPFFVDPTVLTVAPGERQQFQGWLGTGTGSYTGAEAAYFVVMNNPITEEALWQKQYRLDVISEWGTTKGAGWYAESSFATFYVDSSSVRIASGIRYMFTGWIGTGAGSYTDSDTGATVQMNNPIREQANWKLQYYLATAENPDEGGTIIQGPVPPGAWFDNGTGVTLDAVSAGDFEWAGWTGSISTTDRPVNVTMTEPKNVIANFGRKVEITVMADPDDLTFIVDDTTHNTPQTFTWIENAEHTLSAVFAQQEINGERMAFDYWTDGGNLTHIYTVPGTDDTVVVHFKRQYLLQLNSVYGTPTGGGWYDDGAQAYFNMTPLSLSGGPGVWSVFSRWEGTGTGSYTGPASGTVFMLNPITETAVWSTLMTRIQPANGGSVEIVPGTDPQFLNTTVSLIAHPAPLFTFDFWEGAVTGTNDTTQFVISANSTVTANFTTLDTIPPFLFDVCPPPDARMVPVNDRLEFKVRDAIFGVDLASLDVNVAGVPIIVNGVDQTGGNVDISPIANGYHVWYSAAASFPAATSIPVYVSCTDRSRAQNSLVTTYRFTTGSGTITYTSETEIQTSGGTVTDPSGLTITFPPGAVSSTTVISIGTVDEYPALPDTIRGIGLVYHFCPDGFVFNTPITITIPISGTAFVNAGAVSLDSVKVFMYSTATGQWFEVDATVDTENLLVIVTVDHFSYLSLVFSITGGMQVPVDGIAEIYNFPNPFNPELSATSIVYRLAVDSQISLKIYDVSSRLVRVLEENVSKMALIDYSVVWDGRNGQGEYVANNVYFCVLEIENQDRVVRKIAVLR